MTVKDWHWREGARYRGSRLMLVTSFSASGIIWLKNEQLFKKYLHIGKFFHGRETGQIKPRHVVPVFMVITLVFQISKGGSSQSVKL